MASIELRPYISEAKLSNMPETQADLTTPQIMQRTGEKLSDAFFHISTRAEQWHVLGTEMWAQDQAQKALPDYLNATNEWQASVQGFDPRTDQKNLEDTLAKRREAVLGNTSGLARAFLSKHLDAYDAHFLQSGSTFAMAKFHENGKLQMVETWNQASNDLVNQPYDLQKFSYDLWTREAYNTAKGILGSVEAEKIRLQLDDHLWTNIIFDKIRSDPFTAEGKEKVQDVVKNWKDYKNLLPPNERHIAERELKVAQKNSSVSDIVVSLQEKYVDNPEQPLDKDGNAKSPLDLRADAQKEIFSTEFVKKHGVDVAEAVQKYWLTSERSLRDQYNIEADKTKGLLQIDILSGKDSSPERTGQPFGMDSLKNDKRWLSLDSKDRGVMYNFAHAKSQNDYQIIQNAQHLSLARQSAYNQQQQLDAVIFEGKVLGKIADGEYTDANQIIKEYSVPNKYIQAKVNSAVSLFKTIDNAPELKMALSNIKKTPDNLIDPDPIKASIMKGTLSRDIRTKYMSEQDFRGEKVDEWLKTKLSPQVSNSFGKWLNNIGFWSMVDQAKERERLNSGNFKTVTIEGKQYKDGDLIIKQDGTKGIVRVK